MTVEFLIRGTGSHGVTSEASHADELAAWAVTGNDDPAPFLAALRAAARVRAPLPRRLSPLIVQEVLTAMAGAGYKSVTRSGREVLARERFNDGVGRQHARMVAGLLAGVVVTALPAWEQIIGYQREGVLDEIGALRARWTALRASGDGSVFGAYLAAQLAEELRRHDRPMKPLWPTEPRVLARDLSVVDAVHVVEALPRVLDVGLEEDALALELRASLTALGLTERLPPG